MKWPPETTTSREEANKLPSTFFHQYFTYCPETGYLYWKPRPREMFLTDLAHTCFTNNQVGKRAGFKEQEYWKVVMSERGHRYIQTAHYVIWRMFDRTVPPGKLIDHIDRNPENNRIENLRLVDPEGNTVNRCVGKNNTTGIMGVSKYKDRWVAQITVKGNRIDLGRFDTKEEAGRVRRAAELRYWGEFAPDAHLPSPTQDHSLS